MSNTNTQTEASAVPVASKTPNTIEVYVGDKRIAEFSNLDDAIIWAKPRTWSHSLYFENWYKSTLVQRGILKELL